MQAQQSRDSVKDFLDKANDDDSELDESELYSDLEYDPDYNADWLDADLIDFVENFHPDIIADE